MSLLRSATKAELFPFLINRYQRIIPIVYLTVAIGHIVLLSLGFAVSSRIESGARDSRNAIAGIKGLYDERKEQLLQRPDVDASESISHAKRMFWQLEGIVILASLFAIAGCRIGYASLLRRVSDAEIDKHCGRAAINFLMWKLRSPSNAMDYAIFPDYDQISDDDPDIEQLQRVFANTHYSMVRQGHWALYLVPIASVFCLFVPVYGIGLTLISFGILLGLALWFACQSVRVSSCIDYIPNPIASPLSQSAMPPKSDEKPYHG